MNEWFGVSSHFHGACMDRRMVGLSEIQVCPDCPASSWETRACSPSSAWSFIRMALLMKFGPIQSLAPLYTLYLFNENINIYSTSRENLVGIMKSFHQVLHIFLTLSEMSQFTQTWHCDAFVNIYRHLIS